MAFGDMRSRWRGAIVGLALAGMVAILLVLSVGTLRDGVPTDVHDAAAGRDMVTAVLGLPWTVVLMSVTEYIPGNFFG